MFDPDSLIFGLNSSDPISEAEAEVLNSIKVEINDAVSRVAVECGAGGSICIQSVSDSDPTAINAVDVSSLLPGTFPILR